MASTFFREELRMVRFFPDGAAMILPAAATAPARRKGIASMNEDEVTEALMAAGVDRYFAADNDGAALRLLRRFNVSLAPVSDVTGWRATLNVRARYGSWTGAEPRDVVRRAVLEALQGVSSGNN